MRFHLTRIFTTQPSGSRHFARMTGNPWQVFEMQCVDKQLEVYRNMTFANCWHINERENPDMWETYVEAQGNEGIAIQTFFGNLAECFDTSRGLTNLKMQYIDYNKMYLDYTYPNYPEYLSLKDKQFEYENELRIITLEKNYPEFDADEMSMDEVIQVYHNKGEFISVNLKKMINKIYLSPNSTSRFKEHIKKVLEEYDIDVPIIKTI